MAEISDSVVRLCFPKSQASKRIDFARERDRRLDAILSKLDENPESVRKGEIDAVLDECQPALDKLALAQQRQNCVFQPGMTLFSFYPHLRASRVLARLLSLRVRRTLELWDVNAAIRGVEASLRLARDLRPHGEITAQLTSLAIEQMVHTKMLHPILRHSGLRSSHAQLLLTILKDPYIRVAAAEVLQHVDPTAREQVAVLESIVGAKDTYLSRRARGVLGSR